MYSYRVKKYVGAYAAAMGGVDVIVFTGGIGENDSVTRANIIEDMEFLGVDFNFDKNKGVRGKEIILSTPDSRVKVIVVPTNEEMMIAKDTYEIVS
jgi:acetate kinase